MWPRVGSPPCLSKRSSAPTIQQQDNSSCDCRTFLSTSFLRSRHDTMKVSLFRVMLRSTGYRLHTKQSSVVLHARSFTHKGVLPQRKRYQIAISSIRGPEGLHERQSDMGVVALDCGDEHVCTSVDGQRFQLQHSCSQEPCLHQRDIHEQIDTEAKAESVHNDFGTNALDLIRPFAMVLIADCLHLAEVALCLTCRAATAYLSLYPLHVSLHTLHPNKRSFDLSIDSSKAVFQWMDGASSPVAWQKCLNRIEVTSNRVTPSLLRALKAGPELACSANRFGEEASSNSINPLYRLVVASGRRIPVVQEFEYPYDWQSELISLDHLRLLSVFELLSGKRFVQNWG
eukprot:TRINITY_DN33480_c0_g1_i1.p1 TRINITY_DN33480_c0_g1~~TRINITY_DN33480_c0_g1_i1.p1  ORF type:complete len:343 (+),score=23.71 TRINITY_DN33480_c0_g1_i1:104-1132(+)